MYTDITTNILEQDPPQQWRLGAAHITPWLYLGGQEDVCQVLSSVDLWVDFRDLQPTNRKIFLPEHVTYQRLPFKDGHLEALHTTLPEAKNILDEARKNNKKTLISCHAGVSRSAVLALWCLAEEMGDYEEAYQRVRAVRPYIEPHEKFHPFLEELKKRYRR